MILRIDYAHWPEMERIQLLINRESRRNMIDRCATVCSAVRLYYFSRHRRRRRCFVRAINKPSPKTRAKGSYCSASSSSGGGGGGKMNEQVIGNKKQKPNIRMKIYPHKHNH